MRTQYLLIAPLLFSAAAHAQMADNEKQNANASTSVVATQSAIQNDNAVKVAAANPDLKTEDVGLASPGMGSKLADLTKK